MTAAISKRQQARNEKVLQELVTGVPGNNFCADCNALNPSWASWSLGVFLCMRCAAIHRKLGTHISKIKSLSMDTWSNEQVENMRKVGNRTSNQIYNSENLKPSVPIDADEADSAMERFIRQKYMNNSGSQRRGNSRHDEGSPPPLPPKGPGKLSGLRSASSIFPLSSRKKQAAAAAANQSAVPSPQLSNKPSKVFGASVDSLGSAAASDDHDRKLARLREIGFQDARRNSMVLKGVNGNFDRAVEALVRLGDGGSRTLTTSSSTGSTGLRSTRSLTPLSPNTPTRMGFGLSIDHKPNTPVSTTSISTPFDSIPAPPQSSQSTGTMANKNVYANGNTNPFGQPQPLSDFDQAFQNMSIAPTRPLFPNHTGGATGQGAVSMTGVYATQVPPVPPTPSQYLGITSSPNTSSSYSQPATPLSAQNTGYNPFFAQSPATAIAQPPQVQQHLQQQMLFSQQQQQQQMLLQQQQQQAQILSQPTGQQGLGVNTQFYAGGHTNNPFARSPTRIQSPSLGQIPESQQTSFYSGQLVQSPSPASTNPFFTSQQSGAHQQQQQSFIQTHASPLSQQIYQQPQLQQQPPQPPQFQQQQQQHYLPKPDKNSIMSLYNYPQLAPQPTGMAQPKIPPAANAPQFAQPPQPTRSVSTPIAKNRNPFATMAPAVQGPIAAAVPNAAAMPPKPAGSRESIALGMELAWSNGRHSPDAFSGLSARQ
ncbi:hypothetical protein BROUX41_001339 [Berkeleyomyces rouxiae]|uniref:uncharacterized protein n=1 Tax=Berkeleyomyces rouxiae TaxID=2035830 RepID=UPI003B7E2237